MKFSSLSTGKKSEFHRLSGYRKKPAFFLTRFDLFLLFFKIKQQ